MKAVRRWLWFDQLGPAQHRSKNKPPPLDRLEDKVGATESSDMLPGSVRFPHQPRGFGPEAMNVGLRLLTVTVAGQEATA
jgi:hypothetical protein